VRAVVVLCLLSSAALAKEGVLINELPAPVAAYASRFEGECEMNGLGPAVANEMYDGRVFGKHDVNGDGKPDYLAYACMFGCVGAPFAFVTMGLPCASGVLILSSNTGHRVYDLPGTVNRVVSGYPLKVITTRRRYGDKNCTTGMACEYVYELRDNRFQLVGLCPRDGCESLLR
jgi:hypothetical protein